MPWHLQQINNGPPTVPGEYVACPQAPVANAFGPFVCTFTDQQHFTYLDLNLNIQDCWYDGATNQWNLQQINNATGQPTVPGEYVACPQAPVANAFGPFVCTFTDQQHFTYLDLNLNIQDCWYDGATSRWNLQQINNGPPTVPGEYVACPQAPAVNAAFGLFVSMFAGQQHFTYVDNNLNIQDCWYDGATNRWNLQQINNSTGQPTVAGEYVACPKAPISGETGYLSVCVFGNQMHFTYANDNIQDCWYDGATNQWNLQQINGAQPTVPGEYVACPQAPTPAGGTSPVCTFGDQQHFAYTDNNFNIQDCWYDGATNRWNLQQINNAPATVPGEYVACPQAPTARGAGLFVSTFGNQQHFTYLDGNRNIQDCWWG
jgi:hypothetical protein